MNATSGLEAAALWRQVGLDELRQALARIHTLATAFEQALAALPTCGECARAALLDQIRTRGEHLSGDVTSLAVLADTLESGVKAMEAAQGVLAASSPTPCRCESAQCTCHG